MVKKQKGLLIPEEKYNTDFRPITGFYDFHIKKKDISVPLSEIQRFGVNLQVAKRDELGKLDINTLPINTIKFSSSKKRFTVNTFSYFHALQNKRLTRTRCKNIETTLKPT